MGLIKVALELFWIAPLGEKKYHPKARLDFKVIGSEYIDKKMREEAGKKIEYQSVDQIAKRFANCALGYRDQDHPSDYNKHQFEFFIHFPPSHPVKYTGAKADYVFEVIQLTESEQRTATIVFLSHCATVTPHRFPTEDDFITNWNTAETAQMPPNRIAGYGLVD